MSEGRIELLLSMPELSPDETIQAYIKQTHRRVIAILMAVIAGLGISAFMSTGIGTGVPYTSWRLPLVFSAGPFFVWFLRDVRVKGSVTWPELARAVRERRGEG